VTDPDVRQLGNDVGQVANLQRVVNPQGRAVVAIVFLAFLAKAIFYATFLPIGEGYDEYSHYGVVQAMAQRPHLTTPEENGSRELNEWQRLAPVSWMQAQAQPGLITYDQFWRLPEIERARRDREFRSIPPQLAGEPGEPRILLYEGQQPPLAYWLMAVPYRIASRASLPSRVWLLRMFGVVLASLAIPIGYRIAQHIFGDPRISLAAIALAAALPEPIISIARVSNEALALLIGTICVALLVRARRSKELPDAVLLGLALGAALLTKAYFLALIPAAIVVYGRRGWQRAALALTIALAIGGWWYVRNVALTGSLTGEYSDVVSLHREGSLLAAIFHVNWWRALDSTLISHLWLGGWSFLVVRSWMYRIVEVFLAFAIVGMMRRRPPLAILAPQFFLWCGLAYHALATFRSSGISGTLGYYACCLTIAEAICLVIGLHPIATAALVACLAALEVFGAVFYLMPYYAGFTAHTPTGGVPALHLSQLANGGFLELFGRLTWGKPEWLTPTVLIALFAAFLLAALGIAVVSLAQCRASSSPSRS
jgi:4-amino-4-deoxy-L-arabinose transferase-like glycosyltransferase